LDKILIIKTSSLGDIVQAFPALEYLAGKCPQASIDWVVEAPYAELLKAHPCVHSVIQIHTQKWRRSLFSSSTWYEMAALRRQLRVQEYDAVFDLQGNMKSGMVLSQVRSRCKVGFGRKNVSEWPNLLFSTHKVEVTPHQNVRQEYLALAGSFFHETPYWEAGKQLLRLSDEQANRVELLLAGAPSPKVMVCAGSAWKNKQLPAQTLIAFLRRVQQDLKCHFLLMWGSEAERAAAQQMQSALAEHASVVERLSLPLLQHLMHGCALVIAMDSLPLHLAGTTGTPTYSVFGASSAAKYNPLGEKHAAFQGSCPYGKKFERRCPILRTCATGACIRTLEAEVLHDHFSAWWTRAPAPGFAGFQGAALQNLERGL
jgi:heptosyltransferase I